MVKYSRMLRIFSCRHKDIFFRISTVVDAKDEAEVLIGMAERRVRHYQRNEP